MSLEFKRCGNAPGRDVFETVCAFANRQGGSVLLGVADDGSVEGIPKARALDVERSIANALNNPSLFSPAPAVELERVNVGEGDVVIKMWVPMGPSVYRFKGAVYDRLADADVRVTGDALVTAMGIRKQNYYTERRVYPWVHASDLRPDLLDRVREMAAANRSGHPWASMGDGELLRSARLVGHDMETGREGLTLAAVMLLGSDDLIFDVAPTYRTEGLLRRNDVDRYDDRVTVTTNLIEAYDQLVGFCEKWLPDAFALDGTQRVSPRSVIARELVANTLAHREYSSPYMAKLEIGPDYVMTRNASRSLYTGPVTLDNLDPTPKNPVIAGFFAQIGRSEALGSGTRKLYKYSRLYTGADPRLSDGDFFEAVVAVPDVAPRAAPATADPLVEYLRANPSSSSTDVAAALGISARTAARRLAKLVEEGAAVREGNTRSTRYKLR